MLQVKVFNLNVEAKKLAEVEAELNEFIKAHALPDNALRSLESGLVIVRWFDYSLSEGLSVFDQISLIDVHLSKMMNNHVAHEAEYRFMTTAVFEDPSTKNTTALHEIRRQIASVVRDIRILRAFRKDLLDGTWDAMNQPDYIQEREHSAPKILKPGEEGFNKKDEESKS